MYLDWATFGADGYAPFKNHRMCYMRVQSCIANADERAFVRKNSSQIDRALMVDQAEVFS
jgi:hypothetical protein